MRADQSVRASLAWAALLTLALLGPVVYFLLQSIPGRIEEPLATLAPGSQTGTARLLGAPQGSGAERSIAYRLKLTAKDIGRVVSHARIELLTASDRADLLIRSGEIRISGTACIYRASSGTVFPVNDFLPFVRDDECVPLTGAATGEVELTVSVADIARLEVLTFETPAAAPPEHTTIAVVARKTDATHVRAVRGRFVDPYPGLSARRIQLLNYVWQVSSSASWFWMVVATAGALLLVGNLFFWNGDPVSTEYGRSRFVVASAAAALAASLAMFYAVLTPPFQAADEPNHFIAFATYSGRSAMYQEATAWASLGHFERIQFHSREKFGATDIGRAGRPWDDGGYPEPSVRGAGIQILWRALAPSLRHLPAPELLLALRSTNVVLFGASAGGFVLLVMLLTDVPRPHLLAFPLFFVPTIPFFAMHVSNHAPLVCAYIFTGLGVVVWFLDGRRSAAAGALVGTGWALASFLSRGAIPLVMFVAAVAVARVLLGGRNQGWRSSAAFWAGIAIPVIALLYAAEPAYLDSLLGFARISGMPGASLLEVMRSYPWLIAAGAALATAAEMAVQQLRTRLGAGADRAGARLAVLMTRAAALTLILLVIVSAFVRLPTLAVIDPARPPAPLDYVLSTMLAVLTMFRLGVPDFLTSWSFWGGFGWLDTLADWRIVSGLVVATAVSLCTLLFWIGRSRDSRLATLFLFTIAGFAVSVAAYAFSVVSLTPADVHGRYLLGVYLCLLFVAWSALAVIPIRRTWIPALACMAVHGYCLTLILRRYF